MLGIRVRLILVRCVVRVLVTVRTSGGDRVFETSTIGVLTVLTLLLCRTWFWLRQRLGMSLSTAVTRVRNRVRAFVEVVLRLALF